MSIEPVELRERRIKCNISILVVVILCFFCTITTNFEYELKCSKVGFDLVKGERCIFKSPNEDSMCDVDVFDPTCKMMKFDASSGRPCLSNQTGRIGQCDEVSLYSIAIICTLPLNLLFSHCQVHSYSVRQSDFSRSDSYQNFFYYPSTFFGTLLPFVMLSILNGFLIWTVRKSHKIRHAMTNTRQVSVNEINNTMNNAIKWERLLHRTHRKRIK